MVRISEKELIKELLNNGRISFTELAKKFNVTEAAIRKKIHNWEKKGIIKKYTTIFNFKKVGYETDAIIGVDTLPDKYLKVIEMLKNNEKILQLWSSTGDHMIMFRAIFKDHSELESFVKKLEAKEEITKVCPAILLNALK